MMGFGGLFSCWEESHSLQCLIASYFMAFVLCMIWKLASQITVSEV